MTKEKDKDAILSNPGEGDFFEQTDAQGNKAHFVLVCALNDVEANRNFQNNVRIVQAQRDECRKLNERIQSAFTASEKEALAKALGTVETKLKENHELMNKTYGFSLMRNYQMVIEQARLLTQISDEELTKAKASADFKAENLVDIADGKKAMHIATIKGVAENQIFQQNVNLVRYQRERLRQLNTALGQTQEEAEKAKIQEEMKKSEETLIKNNDEMVKRYGYSLMRDYILEIEKAKLYAAITAEEFEKVKEEKAKAKK